MNTTAHIAKHLREVYFGGNWTCSNVKDNLTNVTWHMAVAKVDDFNTVAALTYHMYYYVGAVLKVLQGGPLDASDKVSFDHPAITSEAEWQQLLEKVWQEVEALAVLIEQMPDEQLWQDFVDAKYGNYYRNLQGIIEHTHYHLGQIVIIKKLLG